MLKYRWKKQIVRIQMYRKQTIKVLVLVVLAIHAVAYINNKNIHKCKIYNSIIS